MSMESVASAREIRRRLFDPPNGHHSPELDILAEPLLRRKRLDDQTERARLKHQAKLDAQVARLEALKLAYATALSRRGSGPPEPQAAVVLSSEPGPPIAPLADPLPPRAPYIQQIVAEVCRRYNVTPIDVRSARRKASIVLPRQIVMYIARTITELSYPEIGRRLGNKDHTTVIHAVNKMTYLVENNPHLSAEITDIIATISARQAQRREG